MRQNLKVGLIFFVVLSFDSPISAQSFVSGTDQLLIEDGHSKEEVEDWMSLIRYGTSPILFFTTLL